MKFPRSIAPHTVAPSSVQHVMWLVVAALIPVVLAHIVWFGFGILVQIALAVVSSMLSEAVVLRLQHKPIRRYVFDGSACITGLLLAMALPSLAPWWLTVSGAAFAVVVAKHLYGGLGYNIFNPAMAGYAALLVSFPIHMTRWTLPASLSSVDLSLWQTLQIIFTQQLPPELSWDALSAATPLAGVRTGLIMRNTMDEVLAQPIFGDFAGVGWDWISLSALAGGSILLALKVIRWHIPVAMLGSLFICAGLMSALDPGRYAGPIFHLFGGATMLCAFFIATDPVSAATSNRGRLVYGAGIGALTYIIRTFGGYPDGVAFAVLVMNALVPLIDRYTIPRIYGHGFSVSSEHSPDER